MNRDYNLIAVGVDQAGQVFKAHFGMSPRFLVFNSDLQVVKEIENPYALSGKHHDNPKLVISLLPDVGVFIGHRMGKESREKLRKNLGVKAYLTEEKDPKTAVRAYLSKKNG